MVFQPVVCKLRVPWIIDIQISRPLLSLQLLLIDEEVAVPDNPGCLFTAEQIVVAETTRDHFIYFFHCYNLPPSVIAKQPVHARHAATQPRENLAQRLTLAPLHFHRVNLVWIEEPLG
jgi:hypothetical protein